MNALLAWKAQRRRKPLILKGARQVGKTWLLRDFGAAQYEHVAYVDLLASERARAIFDGDFDTRRIVSALQVEAGVRPSCRTPAGLGVRCVFRIGPCGGR